MSSFFHHWRGDWVLVEGLEGAGGGAWPGAGVEGCGPRTLIFFVSRVRALADELTAL